MLPFAESASGVAAAAAEIASRKRRPAEIISDPTLRLCGPGIEVCSRMSEQSIICVRAFEFGARILRVSEKLWNARPPGGRHLAAQLLASGTSIGANAEEAQEAQTKPDYIAKMSVARKEAREVAYWLRLCVRTQLLRPEDIEWGQREARELLQMIRAAIRTAQSSLHRGGSETKMALTSGTHR